VKHEAFSFLQTRIGRRFLAILLIISLLPLLLMRWLAIRKSEAAINEQTTAVLRRASDGAEAQLREFLDRLREQLLQVAGDRRIGSSMPAHFNPNSELSEILRTMVPEDADEIFLLSRTGDLTASSAANAQFSNYAGSEFFVRGAEGFSAGDVVNDPLTGKPTWIMCAPIREMTSQQLLGVAAFRIDPRKLSELTSGQRILAKGADTQSFWIGDTGETYIVNHYGWMITESRYASNSVLRVKVDTLPVRAALHGSREVTDRYTDYRGAIVSGSSTFLRNPPWILITEIDFKQAFAPITRLRHELIVATLSLIVLAVVLAWSTTWRVLNSIRLLSESDHALAERDESRAFVPENGLSNDEIGDLVRMRNSRVRAVFDYQRQLEDRTMKLQAMIGELEHISYAIVHDMRAPLRAMQGFATMLESDDPGLAPEERRSYLRRISAAAVRLDHLIQDVLAYNRTVLRHAPLNSVDLGNLLRGIVETYPTLQLAKIQIEGTIPPVIGNEALLTQCFSHLLENAVKFAKPSEPPCVHIRTEIPRTTKAHPSTEIADLAGSPQVVRIWIEDNGVGIPRQAQIRIFKMFQRLTEDPHGNGVGLAIVRKVVEKMGGQVGLESEVGVGSRFWVELRQARSSESQPAGSKLSPGGTIDAKAKQFVSMG
jgi:signal transduction histidine kinase